MVDAILFALFQFVSHHKRVRVARSQCFLVHGYVYLCVIVIALTKHDVIWQYNAVVCVRFHWKLSTSKILLLFACVCALFCLLAVWMNRTKAFNRIILLAYEIDQIASSAFQISVQLTPTLDGIGYCEFDCISGRVSCNRTITDMRILTNELWVIMVWG